MYSEHVVHTLYENNINRLKLARSRVNFEIKEERHDLVFNQLHPLIKNWKGPYPNLREFFRSNEIERLLFDFIDHYSIDENKNDNDRYEKWKKFTKFVIKSGYKDEPELGKPPQLHRVTPALRAFRQKPYHWIWMFNQFFKIYDSHDAINNNYVDDETGLTHLHVACLVWEDSGGVDAARRFLELGGGEDANRVELDEGNTPLQLAVALDRREIIELLLRHGADPNVANKYGHRPVHRACMQGCQGDDSLRMLLELADHERYPAVQIDARDKFGNTALCFALSSGNERAAELLLRRGADPNSVFHEGLTALHLICERSREDELYGVAAMLFEQCIINGRPLRVIDARDKKGGDTPLLLALKYRHRRLLELLLRQGADPYATSEDGDTPLRHLARKNTREDVAMLEHFLDVTERTELRRLNVDARDESGSTPLLLALRCGKKRTAELLLRRGGADPNLTDKKGNTPLHWMCRRTEDDDDDLIETFFGIIDETHQTVQVDTRNKSGDTPLHLAMRHGNKRAIESLLLRGHVDPNQTDGRGATPLHIMCTRAEYFADDDGAFADKFFELCAKQGRRLRVDAPDGRGWTPLQLAVARILPHLVRVLLANGADVRGLAFSDDRIKVERSAATPTHPEVNARLACDLLICVELLEEAGHQLSRGDVVKFMGYFAESGLFERERLDPEDESAWCNQEEFASKAKETMINPDLSLYQLVRMPTEEAAKLLTFQDYRAFVRTTKLQRWPEGPVIEACAIHLAEKISRGFFRQRALDPFWELIGYRLPIEICETIIERLDNEDLYNICLAAALPEPKNRRDKIIKLSKSGVYLFCLLFFLCIICMMLIGFNYYNKVFSKTFMSYVSFFGNCLYLIIVPMYFIGSYQLYQQCSSS